MQANPYESPKSLPGERIRDPERSKWIWYRIIGGLLIAYGMYSGSCTGMLFFAGIHKSKDVNDSFQAIVYALLPVVLLAAGTLLFFKRKWLLATAQVLLFGGSLLLALKTVLWLMTFSELSFEDDVAASDDDDVAFSKWEKWFIMAILIFIVEIMPTLIAMFVTFFTAVKLNATIRPDHEALKPRA